VLRWLPGAGSEEASEALSSCRKLGLLADAKLMQAFLALGTKAVPVAEPDVALALLARLLLPLQQQVGLPAPAT
jgi:hypothetical protein